MFDILTLRQITDAAKQVVMRDAKMGKIMVENAVGNPSTYRQQIPITANNQGYVFDFTSNPAGAPTTIQQLRKQDEIAVAYGIKYYLARQSNTDVAPLLEATAGTTVHTTWENPNIFLSAGESDALRSLYRQNLKVNYRNLANYIDGLNTENFRVVPSTQQGTTTAAYGFVNAANADVEETYTQSADSNAYPLGVMPLPRMLVLNGTDSLRISVEGPSIPAAAAAVVANTQNRLCMDLLVVKFTGVSGN